MITVLIPSHHEQFLGRTVEEVFAKARGDIEVIAVLEGYWPDPPLPDDKRLHVIHFGRPKGMRHGINSAAAIARGKYLLKLDAHCALAEGFDVTLAAECDDDWVVIPRRYSLDPAAWQPDKQRQTVDYHYLGYPLWKPDEIGMHGNVWVERRRARMDVLLDDEMSSQGSCWFMTKAHFDQRLGGLNPHGYGQFVQEFQEIGNKTWLGGGQVKINKKTWYAHLHKGKQFGRGYWIDKHEMARGTVWSADYWWNNRWPERKRDIEWLIEHFWPVPTWPEGWQTQRAQSELLKGRDRG